MRVVKTVSLEEILFRGSIKDSDAAKFQAAFAADPAIHEDEALALIALNRDCAVKAPAWRTFFTDTIADFAITQWEPQGYITAHQVPWLVAALSQDGWVKTRTEFDLILAIIERARWVPLSFALFAMHQVKVGVAHGSGPMRIGIQTPPGQMIEEDVTALRRILCAFASETHLAITRAEMEMLLAIDALAARGSAPTSWRDLFGKAVANVVLTTEDFAAPSRAAALQPMARVEDSSAAWSPETGLSSLRHLYQRQSHAERALARLERQRVEIVTQEEFYTPADTIWIRDRFLVAASSGRGQEAEIVKYLRQDALIADAPWPRRADTGGWAA